jgi:hypothetical protein
MEYTLVTCTDVSDLNQNRLKKGKTYHGKISLRSDRWMYIKELGGSWYSWRFKKTKLSKNIILI